MKPFPWLLFCLWNLCNLSFSFLTTRKTFPSNSQNPLSHTQIQTKPNFFSRENSQENHLLSLKKKLPHTTMGKGLLDLEKHFAFYGAYHSNRINIAIHMVFVWPIFFTALLMLYFTPSLFNLPHLEFFLFGTHFVLVLNFGFLLALIYSVFYICLDVKAGSLAALLCAICWVASSFIASRLGFSLAWKVQFLAYY